MINNSNTLERCPAVHGHEQTANQPGKGKWTKLAKLAFIGLASLSMVGCVGRFTGGGSIDSTAGAPEKATFGFVINASDPTGSESPTVIKGQFQYNDHGAGVSFHVDQFEPGFFAVVYPDIDNAQAVIFTYSGTYSCATGTGSLTLGVASDKQVLDSPFGSVNNKDAVFVSVLSGPHAGYENVGLVQNGNIQFKPAKSK